MKVEFTFPKEYNKSVISLISKRRGAVQGSDPQDDYMNIVAEVSCYLMPVFWCVRACACVRVCVRACVHY